MAGTPAVTEPAAHSEMDDGCGGSGVGGASNSRHLHGGAADLVGTPDAVLARSGSRSHGFGGIFGPGYPAHNDHTHVDGRSGQVWSAPWGGVGREIPLDIVPDDQGLIR